MTRSPFTNRLRWWWLLALFAAPVLIVSLTQDIGAAAYDAAVEHILRGVAFSAVIDDGVLYPRWTQTLHWGLGSPLFTFQPPLPYYALDLLHRLGLPHDLGWRWLVAGGFGLAAIGAYLLVREITGRRWPALAAATAYLYAPYILRNALERGSNEAYSVFLYPLVLWSLLWLARRPGLGRFLCAVLAWAACISAHVLGPLMLAPFAGLLALYLAWRRRTLAPLLALLAGGMLTAFIWAPMIPEQAWVHVERDFTQPEAIPADNPILLEDLLAPPAIYDVGRDNNKLGDRVGLPQTILLVAAAPIALLAWRRNRRLAPALLAVTLAGLALFWLFTGWSDWFWRLGGEVMARLLYRTRLMGAQALAAATAIGISIALAPPRWQRTLALAVGGGLLLAALPSLYPQHQHVYALDAPPYDLADVRAMEVRHHGTALTAFGEFTPRWRTAPFDQGLLGTLGAEFTPQERPLAAAPTELEAYQVQVKQQAWDLQLRAAQDVTATLHLLYYPRWRAWLDGQPAALSAQADTGYVQVAVPAGEHHLKLRYGRTAFEWAGIAASVLTALALLAAGAQRLLRAGRGAGPARLKAETGPAGRDSHPAPAVPNGSGIEASAGHPTDAHHRPGRRQPHPQALTLKVPDPALPPAVLLGLTVLLIVKSTVLDPYTTLFRGASTCAATRGAEVQTAVTFGEHIRLCGYDLPRATLRPGERLTITLYWQIDAAFTQPAYSFAHLLGPFNPATGNPLWGQHDKAVPAGLPLPEWLPGKLYQDRYDVQVSPDTQPGVYQLEIGWWQTGLEERLKPEIAANADRIAVSPYDSLLIEGIVIR